MKHKLLETTAVGLLLFAGTAAAQYSDKAIAIADAESRNFVVLNAGRLQR
jgi:hypothetical protein